MEQLKSIMEKPSSIQKFIPYFLLLVLIIFNLFLYKNEFKVLSDPNDGNFHFALISEAKNIWTNVFAGKLSPFYLFDSWNERWADGFSLSLYYSHLPEAAISLLSFIIPISTFKLFVIIRTLLLILLPVSFFIGARILGFSSGFGLILAFLSQAIFTDGLYGLDSSSFLWRGWGLFSQLLAIFILPIAFGYAIDYLKNKQNLGKAIIFNFLLAQAHFGMFYLLLFAYPVFWLFSLDQWFEVGKRTLVLLLMTLISLAYFILPFLLTTQYRNFSFWDPIWKFNSWGLNQILTWLLNGDLFDFKRFPFLTITVFGGVFWGLISKNKVNRYLVVLCCLYFVLFVGKDILGPLVNLIPGLNEFHLHRVIVMFQFIALLIASNWLYTILQFLIEKKYFKNPIIILLVLVLGSFSIYLMENPIINYVKDNDTWLATSNKNYRQDSNAYQTIVNSLNSLPSARIYAGQPGNWGKEFKMGDTQIYMALSRDGFPTVGFLPESWSPNSDPEQFFSEDDQNFYNLYNIGYLLLPKDKKPPQFAKLIINKGRFSLYKITTDGWFGLGRSSQEVISKKTNLLNIVHRWFNSSLFKDKEYPIIGFDNKQYSFVDRIISMASLNSYFNVSGLDEIEQNIWQTNPLSKSDDSFNTIIINKVEEKTLQGYSVSFKLENKCDRCILILRQSFHPDWQVLVNGKKQTTFPVFPFFIGIRLNNPGDYKIIATYQPTILKIALLFFEIIFFIFIFKKIVNSI